MATLLDFATKELTTAKDQLKNAQDAFKNATDEASKADENLSDIGKQITAETDAENQVRRKFTPNIAGTDAEDLVQELSVHEIRSLELTAKLTVAQKATAMAKARIARLAGQVARAKTAVADAAKAKDDATKRADDFAKNVTKPVADVRAKNPSLSDDATAVLASQDYKDAKKRVEGEVPDDLRTDGLGRVKAIRDEAAKAAADEEAAADTAATARTDQFSSTGAVLEKRMLLERQERRLRTLVNAPREIDQIKSALKGINDAPKLNPNKLKRIDDKGTTVTAADEDRTKADKAVADQEKKIADKEAEIAAPPAGADLNALRAELAALKGPLPKLKADAAKAKTTHDDALDGWKNEVPDEAWRRLLVFDDLNARLNDLKKLTPVEIDKISKACNDA